MTPLLHCEGICQSFGGVAVLKHVTLGVPEGSTLGLVGENGAGKSTLMNILGGNLRPDAGRMTFAGRAYAPATPAEAASAGVALVHQELNLFPNLSVAENLFLTRFTRCGRLPLIHRSALRAATERWLEAVGLDTAPDTPVELLSPGECQLVEIARALSLEPKLLILDEPTTSLSDRETGRVFDVLARLHARGLAMIYISHTLEDVLRLSDQVAVLRDGELVATAPATEFTKERLVTLMVGRSLQQLYPPRSRPPGGAAASGSVPGPAASAAPLFQVRSLTQPGVVHAISFDLHAGEILGLFGLMGAGRTELARMLFGLEPWEQGEVRIAGQPLTTRSSARRIQYGLAFVTEDRRSEGLALEASIGDNLALVTLRQHARPVTGWLNGASLGQALAHIREAVKLTPTARDSAPAKTLSGGNQQKVVLAKWLLARPRVLILDEPTRGIDVGAKFEIYQLIQQLADAGAGVLVISSEIEELLGLCDRILVMRRGELVEALPRTAFDRERILCAALHERRAS